MFGIGLLRAQLVIYVVSVQILMFSRVIGYSEDFSKQLYLFGKNTEGISSFLENLDKYKSKSTSSNTRRRTVVDRDCDNVQQHIDSIEGTCDQYRYQVLTKLIPDYQNLVMLNSTFDSEMLKFDTEFNGDPMRPGEVLGLLNTLLMQRVALYGGVNPDNNMTEIGLLKRFELTYGKMRSLSGEAAASLDSLWAATSQVDRRIANKLYTQLFAYATESDKLLMNIQNTSTRLLAADVASIAQLTNSLNVKLLNISNTVCDTQKSVGISVADSFKLTASALPELTSLISDLMSQSDKTLSAFDDISAKGSDAIDQTIGQSDEILADNLQAIKQISQSYAQTYVTALNRVISTFGSQLSFNATSVVNPLVWRIGNFSKDYEKLSTREQSKIDSSAASLLALIDSLKTKLETRISKAQQAQAVAVAAADAMISNTTDLVSTNSNDFADSQKQLSLQFSGAQSSLNSKIDSAKNSVNSLLTAAKDHSDATIARIGQTVDDAHSELVSGAFSHREAVDGAIGGVVTSLASGSLAAHQVVNSQISTLSKTGQLADAQIGQMTDGAAAAVRSGLSPLLNDKGSVLVNAVTEIQTAKSSAVRDMQTAASQNQAALQDGSHAVSALAHVLFMKGSSTVANELKSHTALLQNTAVSLKNTAGLLEHSVPLGGPPRVDIGALSGQLATVDDDLASQLGKKAKLVAGENSNSLNNVVTDVNGKLNSLLSPLASLVGKESLGTSPMPVSPGKQQIVSLVQQIENELKLLQTDESRTALDFQRRMHSAIPKITLPNVSTDDFVGNLAKRLASEMVKARLSVDHLNAGTGTGAETKLNILRTIFYGQRKLADNSTFGKSVLTSEQEMEEHFWQNAKAVDGGLINSEADFNAYIDKLSSDYFAYLSQPDSTLSTLIDDLLDQYNQQKQTETEKWTNALEEALNNQNVSVPAETAETLAEAAVGWLGTFNRTPTSVPDLTKEETAAAGLSTVAAPTANAQTAINTADRLVAKARALADTATGFARDFVGRSNAQSSFYVHANLNRAAQMAGDQSHAVDSVLTTVSEFNDAQSQVGLLVSNQTAGVRDALSDSQVGLEDALGILAQKVSTHAQSGVANATNHWAEYQLGSIQKFTRLVSNSWTNFVDLESKKFQKMSDDDKASLDAYLRLVNSGKNKTSSALEAAVGGLHAAQSALEWDESELDSFQTEFRFASDNLTRGTLDEDMPNLLLNATNFDPTNAQINAEASIAQFENGLDEIANQVLA